jgi:hypothetical protein
LAIADQVSAIKREANEKYDLMDHCLELGEYEAAAEFLERAEKLKNLAARLEMRQAALVAADGLGKITDENKIIPNTRDGEHEVRRIESIADEHNAIRTAVRELMQ